MSTHYNAYSLPMPIHNHKGQQYPNYNSTYSVSPPETDESVSSGTGPSYSHSGYSVANSSYAGSHSGDFESAHSASGVDFNDYMQDRFAQTFDPIPLDRNIAVQAQTSGKLNAKHRELLELQKKAQARLAKTRERFNEGYRDAQDVRADLEWTQKKVTSLKSKTSRKHNKEYNKARARYPSPEF
ncbi:Biogenesis of lysosome-related organelles complex 1 subunit KXD1 [Colletotrichum sidae]|uniref:Biogenesis of lysosome-related organelles complex 1 subunit KXD1 n=3 Tax=Colletotrichum orbiculare species complex TaxID=2707354 RepID=A0A4R8RKK4_COLTR|nr:Biogenesis of lysosome-related organelles complex 1 subunit KXD1 [Colletotrichum spinosum]TDZ67342.1 Biogenesis of lysosome-related organelles complex 1 subunit KXD1 [Colletotrichum trifolii]TEA18182.1 Biogenesis of lysosome-related organelles complex 1 subunit KXD1 [Colletotrichum sidae]